MSITVKICGITSVDDAHNAVEAGANALGLMFYEQSPRFLRLEEAETIAAKIPAGTARVGVFVNAAASFIQEAMDRCGLTILQFHGDESPEFCTQFGMMTMKAFRIRDASSIKELPAYRTNAWLLDSYVPGQPGGTGETFNWDLAREAGRLGTPVFVAGGLTAANVGSAIAAACPFGVDVSSGVESAPGKKDPAKMKAFVAAVRRAE